MNKDICTLEELLQAVGAKKPFNDNQELTADGEKALNVLYKVLWYLDEQQVISFFNPHKLDSLISETAY